MSCDNWFASQCAAGVTVNIGYRPASFPSWTFVLFICVWDPYMTRRQAKEERKINFKRYQVSISSKSNAQILRAKVLFGSFLNLHVTREKLPERCSYEKRAHKTLMKLTPEIKFLHIWIWASSKLSKRFPIVFLKLGRIHPKFDLQILE